jgi:anti-sigma regulatory factor (Ser/Thr protein kinase)
MTTLNFKITNGLYELNLCRQKIEDFLVKNTPFDSTNIKALVLAVDEAVSNILVHGTNTNSKKPFNLILSVKLKSIDDQFGIEIQDNCSAFNPLEGIPENRNQQKNLLEKKLTKNVENGKGSGLGVAIYLKIMDKIDYKFDKKRGNILKLTKYF